MLADFNPDVDNVSDSIVGNTKAPESIKVLVRVRPIPHQYDPNDPSTQSIIDITSDTSLTINEGKDRKKNFQCAFDAVLSPSATQADVYNTVRSCTASVLDGFNSTIFAYGQTGSGKTHSMYGPPLTDARYNMDEFIGLIPRAISEIFAMVGETMNNRNPDSNEPVVMSCAVYCSFVQIYNENLFDMLRDSSMADPLSIREERKEIYVQGLSEYNIKNVDESMQLLRIAEENRAIRETHMNQFSSRSHSIFQIFIDQKLVASDGGEITRKSKFNLVDLAGSEKWNIKHNNIMRDEHIQEMTNINLSLHTLGRCISSLASISHGKDAHVPYRESKLTRLLQDSLGGNAKTFLIATVSPARSNCEETISTLKFADRAKQVMVQAVINDTRPIDHELVERLRKEIEHLKQLLKQYTDKAIPNVTGDGSPTIESNNLRSDPMGSSGVQPHHIGYVHPVSSNQPIVKQFYNGELNAEALNQLDNSSLQLALEEAKAKNNQLLSENKHLKNEISRYIGDASVSNTIGGNQGQGMRFPQIHNNNGMSIQTNIPMPNANGYSNPPSNARTTGNHTPNQRNNSNGVGMSGQQSGDGIYLHASDAKVAVQAVEGVMEQNSTLWTYVDDIQKLARRFFKYEVEEEDYQKMCNQIFDKLRLLRDEGQSGLNSRCSTSNLATLLGVIDDTPRNKGPEGKVSNSNNSNRNAQQHRVVAGNHVPSEYNPNSNQNMQQKQQQLAQLQAQLGNNLKHKVTSPRQGKNSSSNHQQDVGRSNQPHNNQFHNQEPSVGYQGYNNQNQGPDAQFAPDKSKKKSKHRYDAEDLSKRSQQPESIRIGAGGVGNAQKKSIQNNLKSLAFGLDKEKSSDPLASSRSIHSLSDEDTDAPMFPSIHNHGHQNYKQQSNNQREYAEVNVNQGKRSSVQQYDDEVGIGHSQHHQRKSQQVQSNHFHAHKNNDLSNKHSNINPNLIPTATSPRGNQLSKNLNLNLSYRVRESAASDDTAWMNSNGLPIKNNENIDEEMLLAEQIKAAKKQLKKQEKLRAYQAAKEEKARLQLEKELEEKRAIEEAEREKEAKRLRRAQKQKEKLKDYSVKIKTEAETIQELIALGIDPASLLSSSRE